MNAALLAAVQGFQAEISPANTARTRAAQNEKYARTVNAFRKHLIGPRRHQGEDLNFYMITTRPPQGPNTLSPK